MHQLSYKEKIFICKTWLPEIVSVVKKDLKQEHLPKDRSFCQRHFLGKSFAQVTKKELADAYLKEIEAGNDALSEFICSRWLLKNTDIYAFFESTLQKISNDIEVITEIEEKLEEKLKKEAVEKFGSVQIFIFSLFNSVVFREKVFLELQKNAEKQVCEESEQREKIAYEHMQQHYERKMNAMREKYEKKLSGFQTKYLKDISKLQNEIKKLKTLIS